jgi:hypothetical protein
MHMPALGALVWGFSQVVAAVKAQVATATFAELVGSAVLKVNAYAAEQDAGEDRHGVEAGEQLAEEGVLH